MDHCPLIWPRAIILVDMNAFFASVEQRDFPHLRGHPVAVTNGLRGTTIITCSYEARARGVKTGMRLKHALALCPELIRRSARPKVYSAISSTIMASLEAISPDIEVFSVDEAFIDVSRCQRLHGTPVRMAQMVKRRVEKVSGLLCSVGVSGDKTTAKFAAKLQKPDGLTVIAPWEARQRLAEQPTTALCGIAKGIGTFLASYGIHRCCDVSRLPISVLGDRFGNPGRRIWLMCQGLDPEPVHLYTPPPKSVGHGKVVPPATRDRAALEIYLLHMSEKVAARLRRHYLEAQRFYIALRSDQGWISDKLSLAYPSADGTAIFQLCRFLLDNRWQGTGIHQVQVTALDPRPEQQQLDLFARPTLQRDECNRVMDRVNERYGDYTLTAARLLGRSEAPDVIAPSWRPSGPRKSV